MANEKKNWPEPDDFESPKPHKAPEKSVVEKVLDAVLSTGNGAVSLLAGLLAGVLVLYSGYVIYDSIHTQYSAYSSAWDLLQYKPEFIDEMQTPLSSSALEDINEDYRAWLTVYDTSIDYPVVQGADDLYYAWHDIYKQSSLTGAIYLAHQNSPDFSDSYNLIYGHHMDNGAMFGRLDSFRDQTYYDEHREGVIVSKSGVYDLLIFGVARTDAYENRIYTVGNRKDEVIDFLSSGGEGGVGIGTEVLIYDEAVAQSAEKVVALSTCASADTSGRLVVFGRLTRRALITLEATGYEGVYDGEPHTLGSVVPSVEDALIEYSVDGGATWTTEMPAITDVGEREVAVRATSDTNGVATTSVKLIVHPRPVTVTVGSYSKTAGDPDPVMTASVEGLLGGEKLGVTLTPGETTSGGYTVRVTGSAAEGFEVTVLAGGKTVVTFEVKRDPGETAGSYNVRVTADEKQFNGNYEVACASGTLTISAAPAPAVTPGVTGGPVVTTSPSDDPEPTDEPEAQTISLTVRKVWVNDDASTRPNAVRMVLSGDVSQTVTLSAANGWTATVTVPAGGSYAWSEPSVTGYRQSLRTSADGLTTTITNTRIQTTPAAPESHTLTVRYRYLNGDPAAPDYTGTFVEGAAYDVASPAIPGYTAAPLRVTGTMPGRDVEYTVLYIPGTPGGPGGPGTRGTGDGGEELTVIDDYGTPLGVNGAYIDTGDCFE